LAKLCGAPFIKVEATKYTEVGYVGRDVESMVRDLMASAVAMVKEEMETQVREEAKNRAEDRLLDLLLPGITSADEPVGESQATVIVPRSSSETKEKFRTLLREGKLDSREIEISVPAQGPQIELFAGSQFEEMNIALGGLQNFLGGKKRRGRSRFPKPYHSSRQKSANDSWIRKKSSKKPAAVPRSRGSFLSTRWTRSPTAKAKALPASMSRGKVSSETFCRSWKGRPSIPSGVPSTPPTSSFIGAGAFNVSKPQDLIPELQGRFPIRVELDPLSGNDFVRILTEPKNALVTQYIQLLGTEDVELEFTKDAIARIAEIAEAANRQNENIGARRLQTVMERLLEDVSFDADNYAHTKVTIDKTYVDEQFKDYVEQQDLSKYIL